MPYPDSPFDEVFNLRILTKLKGHSEDKEIQIDVQETLKWLCTSPKITSYRVNSLKTNKVTVLNQVQEELDNLAGQTVIKAEFSHILSDVILVKHVDFNPMNLKKDLNEVIVDMECGAAILRGAHIYAPGVLSMISGTQKGDEVSIYADLSKKCKRGLLKRYRDDGKVFIGNGIVKMTRPELFGEHLNPNGIAIEVTDTISGCPSIGDDFLPVGSAVLQNVPSIICVHVLNPMENDIVLDMCAAPGNKTTHIAALMKNKGTLVAIDKTTKKLEQLKRTCQDFNANVFAFQADSSKILDINKSKESYNPDDGPPFLPKSFGKILLDAPCSALGKRPQFSNKTSEKVIRSFVPLQRKLFESGTLVAIDKTTKKLEQLKRTCQDFNANVFAFQADSSKILDINKSKESYNPDDGPPFLPKSFGKILLDAPCSALGKRPQFSNKTSEKVIRSFVPLQRKLFESAVSLLIPGGILVYSTCTITLAENEGIVAWALDHFDCLELRKPELYLGEPGWPGTTLTDENRTKVQRFGPDQEFDSVGFFIAYFVKK